MTSIKPVQLIAAAVQDGLGVPEVLLPPGASPHNYALRPSDVRRVQSADLLYWIGPDMEGFLPRVLKGRTLPSVALQDLPGLTLRRFAEDSHSHAEEADDHDHDHRPGSLDAHLWLSPVNARVIAGKIASDLSAADPANAAGVISVIERAVGLVMAGKASAICTAPIHKKVLKDGAGFKHPGHTEYLAFLAGVDRVVMMLAAPALLPIDTGDCDRCNNDHGFLPDGRIVLTHHTGAGAAIYALREGGAPEVLVGTRPSWWHGAAGGRIVYAAARDGDVTAFERASGKELWSVDLADLPINADKRSARLSGGLVSRYGKLFLGSENGVVYALNEANGEVLWQTTVPGEVVASPAVEDGRVVVLSGAEFRLLRVFIAHANKVLSREQLVALSTGRNYESQDRAIDLQVSRLRNKLADDGGPDGLIKTVRNEGYVLATAVTLE